MAFLLTTKKRERVTLFLRMRRILWRFRIGLAFPNAFRPCLRNRKRPSKDDTSKRLRVFLPDDAFYDVTSALSTLMEAADHGDQAAADTLFATLYADLHRMARRELARRGAGVTLGATTLLHEAYLDISDRDRAAFPDRHRFMAYASRVMRGLIIDYARRRQAQKRGGEFEITSIATDVAAAVPDIHELTRVSDALDELEATDSRLARIVDFKFFCGFSFGEIASMMRVSERTVQRDWDKARIYLHRALRETASAA
jgi:RNA polymerase sigma factor (TIGR02999 family)